MQNYWGCVEEERNVYVQKVKNITTLSTYIFIMFEFILFET